MSSSNSNDGRDESVSRSVVEFEPQQSMGPSNGTTSRAHDSKGHKKEAVNVDTRSNNRYS